MMTKMNVINENRKEFEVLSRFQSSKEFSDRKISELKCCNSLGIRTQHILGDSVYKIPLKFPLKNELMMTIARGTGNKKLVNEKFFKKFDTFGTHTRRGDVAQ